MYSMLVFLMNSPESIHPVLRHSKAFISTLLLGLVFYNLAMRSVVTSIEFVNILIFALLLNAIVILLSIAVPDVKVMLAGLYGFNKKFVELRGFGLTSGYDAAGYLCVFGTLLSAASSNYKNNILYSLVFVMFIAVAFFPSRSSMVLAIFVVAVVCLFFLLKGRRALKVLSV